jgi:glucan phosphoethanolaminetransferase (alkaline phosphatase superfamily)
MAEHVHSFFTVQLCLYYYLFFGIAMLLALYIKPEQVAPLFKKKRVSLPLTMGVVGLIIVFFQRTLSEYNQNYKSLPANIEDHHNSIDYLRWQKERLKLERDGYLSIACVLAQVFLISASNLIETHRAFKEYKEREKKVE